MWGYDNNFMEACRQELTIEPRDLRSTSIVVFEENGKVVGVAQVKVVGSEADFLKLFVEPTTLRGGVGRTLFVWATDQATSSGANRLTIEADPDAVPFYRRMGAEDDLVGSPYCWPYDYTYDPYDYCGASYIVAW